jgi:hypothetical protein
MIKRKDRDIRGRFDNSYVIKHEAVPYSIQSNNRYKHFDEITLFDGITIKAMPSPLDLAIIPIAGVTPYTVPKHMENRIDLVSLKFYGTSDMYWAICYANGIADPLNLPAKTILAIPHINGLRQFPNPLS